MLNSKTVSLTSTKTHVTLKYSAPEILNVTKNFIPTPKVDVYSFGITL